MSQPSALRSGRHDVGLHTQHSMCAQTHSKCAISACLQGCALVIPLSAPACLGCALLIALSASPCLGCALFLALSVSSRQAVTYF
eukprot:16437151-Heterocapsa_arctica.AAC.1